ncbi:hypothetical protein LZL87_004084 [Fusarium oxysporum]|nr:hypothetical protein LZL87_004084 [Fusarium oxysporum]
MGSQLLNGSTQKQQIALIGIFSLGAITLIVSLSRFIAYNATDFELDDQSGNTLSLAEMSTAVIVVCLPGLRRFIMRSKSSTNRSSSNQPSDYGVHTKITGRGQNTDAYKGQNPPSQYAKWGVRDDEIELVTHIRVSHELVNPDDTRSASGQSAIKEEGDDDDDDDEDITNLSLTEPHKEQKSEEIHDMEINGFADKQEYYTDYEDREGDIPGLDKIGIRERPLKRF